MNFYDSVDEMRNDPVFAAAFKDEPQVEKSAICAFSDMRNSRQISLDSLGNALYEIYMKQMSVSTLILDGDSIGKYPFAVSDGFVRFLTADIDGNAVRLESGKFAAPAFEVNNAMVRLSFIIPPPEIAAWASATNRRSAYLMFTDGNAVGYSQEHQYSVTVSAFSKWVVNRLVESDNVSYSTGMVDITNKRGKYTKRMQSAVFNAIGCTLGDSVISAVGGQVRPVNGATHFIVCDSDMIGAMQPGRFGDSDSCFYKSRWADRARMFADSRFGVVLAYSLSDKEVRTFGRSWWFHGRRAHSMPTERGHLEAWKIAAGQFKPEDDNINDIIVIFNAYTHHSCSEFMRFLRPLLDDNLLCAIEPEINELWDNNDGMVFAMRGEDRLERRYVSIRPAALDDHDLYRMESNMRISSKYQNGALDDRSLVANIGK